MRALSVITLLVVLIVPTGVSAEIQTFIAAHLDEPVPQKFTLDVSAEIQTFTATHTYILGDHDSKDDARQRCLLETKRKILEQAGVYIESASEVNNSDLTKDKITSFAAAVMQVKDTKEEVGFQQGHMVLTLTTTAQVDLEEVRKQLAARQLDAKVRDTVAIQQERLERLEAQLETMQQQMQASRRAPASPPIDISVEDLQMLRTLAAQGDAWAQNALGWLYFYGRGIPQDYEIARQWFEKAAAQGDERAQNALGMLYAKGLGVPQDYATARGWYEKAAAQGNAMAQNNLGMLYSAGKGVPQDYAKARQWRERAAAQGNAWAHFNLGVMYEFGQGVPQDYVHAHMWYNIAAAHMTGDQQKFAIDGRDRVARSMTPTQVAEAQQLAREWKPKK